MTQELTDGDLSHESGKILQRREQYEHDIVTRGATPSGGLTNHPRFVVAAAAVALFRGAPPLDAERFRADLYAYVEPPADT